MARDFTATSDKVNCGSAASTDQQNTFTYCAWVAPDNGGGGGNGRIVGKGDFRKEFNIDNVNVNRGLKVYVHGDSGNAQAVSDANVFGGAFDGTWRFVACTFSLGTGGPRIYRNTSPAGEVIECPTYAVARTDTISTVNNDSTHDLCVGARPASADLSFDGRIAEVRCWNVVLTLEEIQAAARGFMVRPQSLFLYLPMFGVSSPEPDLSGNANNGTVTGTARFDHPPAISAYGWRSRGRVISVPSAAPSVTSDMWNPYLTHPDREPWKAVPY